MFAESIYLHMILDAMASTAKQKLMLIQKYNLARRFLTYTLKDSQKLGNSLSCKKLSITFSIRQNQIQGKKLSLKKGYLKMVRFNL